MSSAERTENVTLGRKVKKKLKNTQNGYWVVLSAMSYFTIPGVAGSIPSGVGEIINFF